jgi:hypothetical protein
MGAMHGVKARGYTNELTTFKAVESYYGNAVES